MAETMDLFAQKLGLTDRSAFDRVEGAVEADLNEAEKTRFVEIVQIIECLGEAIESKAVFQLTAEAWAMLARQVETLEHASAA